MKVRLISTMAGPAGAFQAGQVVEFSDKQARELIAGGYAVAYEPVEAAAEQQPETATRPAPKPRRRAARRKTK